MGSSPCCEGRALCCTDFRHFYGKLKTSKRNTSDIIFIKLTSCRHRRLPVSLSSFPPSFFAPVFDTHIHLNIPVPNTFVPVKLLLFWPHTLSSRIYIYFRPRTFLSLNTFDHTPFRPCTLDHAHFLPYPTFDYAHFRPRTLSSLHTSQNFTQTGQMLLREAFRNLVSYHSVHWIWILSVYWLTRTRISILDMMKGLYILHP